MVSGKGGSEEGSALLKDSRKAIGTGKADAAKTERKEARDTAP